MFHSAQLQELRASCCNLHLATWHDIHNGWTLRKPYISSPPGQKCVMRTCTRIFCSFQ